MHKFCLDHAVIVDINLQPMQILHLDYNLLTIILKGLGVLFHLTLSKCSYTNCSIISDNNYVIVFIISFIVCLIYFSTSP